MTAETLTCITETPKKSHALFEKAQQMIPGGVNSPVRAFGSVGGEPRFIAKAAGPIITDADGNDYIDYIGSWGPMVAGHNHPNIIQAVKDAVDHGLSFGAPTENEVNIAEIITRLIPSIEQVRMTCSGTEACMTAVRLARGYTGRDKIIKFIGCYHGHVDALLVEAGSGAMTLGVPNSPGIPADFAKHTLVANFNDLAAVEDLFAQYPDDIAGIIVEPIAGNMNMIPPEPGFLEGLRAICDQYNAVLIFDEVMTGFRVALGGAQAIYNITPDLTTLGKVIGAGMPVGALGGKKAIMQHLAPAGPVYQAGTLSGNPVAMAAGLANLDIISKSGFFDALALKATALCKGLEAVAEKHGLPFYAHSLGGMFGFFFSDKRAKNLADVSSGNHDRFNTFFHAMLDQGVYLAPSAYEAGFISASHTEEHIEQTLVAADKAMATLV